MVGATMEVVHVVTASGHSVVSGVADWYGRRRTGESGLGASAGQSLEGGWLAVVCQGLLVWAWPSVPGVTPGSKMFSLELRPPRPGERYVSGGEHGVELGGGRGNDEKDRG